MDLSTLTLVSNEPILDGLELLQSDCVYRCRIRGEEGYIFIGTEHQNYGEALMAFRAHRYAVGIMHNYLQSGHKKLPIVISLVLYHGTKSPYPYSTEIWDCFEQPELAKKWALQPFHLIDLTVMSDEAVKRYQTAAVMGMLFKHYRNERLVWLKNRLEGGSLAIILSKIGKDYLFDVGRYLLKVCGSDEYPEERYRALEILSRVDPEVGEKVMTFAEQFKQEGRQRGHQQGLQQGLEQGEQHGRQDERFAIARRMLARGADIGEIEEVTELSCEEISSLQLH